MARKKAIPAEDELLPIILFQALRAAQNIPPLDDLKDADAVYAAMEFSTQLFTFAHDLAEQAIPIQGFDKEADRIAAAKPGPVRCSGNAERRRTSTLRVASP